MKKILLWLAVMSFSTFSAWSQSVADYNSSVEYYNSGNLKQQKGDLDGAIADWTKAIEFNPNNSEAHINRSLAKQDKGDLDGAMAELLTAVASVLSL
jgi:tetratricopeptide (TPR) repeat protein